VLHPDDLAADKMLALWGEHLVGGIFSM